MKAGEVINRLVSKQKTKYRLVLLIEFSPTGTGPVAGTSACDLMGTAALFV